MHSALPVSESEKSGYFSAAPRNRSISARIAHLLHRVKVTALYNTRVQWLVASLALFCIALYLLLAGQSPHAGTGGVYNEAHTVSVVKEPYIFPDLSKLEEYRKSKTVELKDGRKVQSSKHSIIYKPGKSQAHHFSAQALLGKILGRHSAAEELQNANPPLVLVLGLDAQRYSKAYLSGVLADRLAYAKRHGYGLYARYLQDFQPEEEVTGNSETKLDPLEWAKVHLTREAMFAFTDGAWLWWLEQDAVILNHSFDIGAQVIFDKHALSQKMIRDAPIIPPKSIIHTYKFVPSNQIKLITTQNELGISMSSYLVRNDELYGRVLFDYLRDPLHRTYPGFRSSGSGRALEAAMTHLVQWHPAILSRMALVSPLLLGAFPQDGKVQKDSFVYLTKASLLGHRGVQDGDYIADEWNVARSTTDPKV